MDQTLNLLREELIPSLPMNHKTVIEKYPSQHLDYDYSIQCGCGYVIARDRDRDVLATSRDILDQ